MQQPAAQPSVSADEMSEDVVVKDKTMPSVKSFLQKAKMQDEAQADDTQTGSRSVIEPTAGSYMVQVLFEDPHQLLSTVSHDNKAAYFALCDQLLDKSLQELLDLPLLAGVNAEVVKHYDDKGAKIVIDGEDYAKKATAAVFLSKLMLMLNQAVYDKHREIRRPAWQIRTTVSGMEYADVVLGLTNKRKETPLILIDEQAQEEVKVYAELVRLDSPKSIHERESRSLASVSKATAERLRKAMEKVLL